MEEGQTYRVVKAEAVGGGGPAVAVRVRGEDGESKLLHDTDFKPYFYSEEESLIAADAQSLKGNPVQQRVCTSTRGVQLRRGKYDFHCEADIPYPRRWMIDRDVYAYVDEDLNPVDDGDVDLVKVYWDIEVAEEEFKDPEETGHIVMITFFNEATQQMTSFAHVDVEALETELRTFEGDQGTYPWEVHFLPSERALLQHTASWIRNTDLDLLVGFNSEDYDWPMLLNRARKIGANVQTMSKLGEVTERNLPGIQLVDAYQLYTWSRPTKERDASLKAIAVRNGYRDYPELGSEVYDYYRDGRIDELLEYNALDVEATWFVDDAEDLTFFALAVQEMVGTDEVMCANKVSVITDILCLREARERAKPLPSKGHMGGAEGGYTGGEVMEPKRGGVIDKVAVYDFSRMFPNLIIQLNISPETLIEEEADWVNLAEGVQGYKFRQDEQGILAAATQEAFEIRNYCEGLYAKTGSQVWKKRIVASKFILNGVYGSQGAKHFRLYDRRVAETVTGASRCLILLTTKYLEEQGWDVTYGDSDSVFVPTEDPWKTEEDVQWAVEQAASDMGMDPIEIEFEKWYHSLLMVPGTKKRYAGFVVQEDGEWLAEPELEVKGFEKKRSDSPEILAEAQGVIFDQMLKGKPRRQILRTTLEFMWRIAEGKVPVEKLANAPQLSKDPAEYSGYGPARAAKFSNRFFDMDIRAGDRVLPVYVKETPDGIEYHKTVGIRPGDPLPGGVVPNLQLMAQKAIGSKFADMFDAIGWKHEADRVRNAWDQPLASIAAIGEEPGEKRYLGEKNDVPETTQTKLG